MERTITHQTHVLHNKRMQSDQTTRYARALTADAGRYAAKALLPSQRLWRED